MAALRVFLAATALALPLWVAATTPVRACTCLPQTLTEQVIAADLIVIATMTDRHQVDVPPSDPLSPPDDRPDKLRDDPVLVTVDVDEYLKGSGLSTLQYLEAPPSFAACQLGGEVGSRYLLFFREGGAGELSTSFCTRSGLATGASVEEVRQILRDAVATPTVELPPVGTAPPQRDGPSMSLLVAAGGAGAALASAALLLRHRGDG